MKSIFMVAVVLIFTCCKKQDVPVLLTDNNMVNATVVLMTGDTVRIHGSGAKALMGCSMLGGGSFIAVTDEMNRAVYTNIYSGTASCVNRPGTYAFNCEYRVNVSSQSSPIYTNSFVADRGKITFTRYDGTYAEGYFSAVCKYLNDSVKVQGTFKGYMPS